MIGNGLGAQQQDLSALRATQRACRSWASTPCGIGIAAGIVISFTVLTAITPFRRRLGGPDGLA